MVREMLNAIGRHGPEILTMAEQALLFMVFALGALIKNDSRSEMYYKHTQAVSLDVYEEPSAESVAFAFLKCLFQQTTGRISAAWTTLGIVIRIAQSLGCN